MVGACPERSPCWAARAVHGAVHAGAVLAGCIRGCHQGAGSRACPLPHDPAAFMHAHGHCLAQQAQGGWAISCAAQPHLRCKQRQGLGAVADDAVRHRAGGPLSQTMMPLCRWPQFTPHVGRPPTVATTQPQKGLSSCSRVGGRAGGRARGVRSNTCQQDADEEQHATTQGEDGSCTG